MNLATTSIRFKIALFFLVLAFILHLVGYSTAAWFTTDLTVKIDTTTAIVTVQLGLWRLCSCADTVCLCISLPIATGWFQAVRVLESVSLVTLLICGIRTFAKLFGNLMTNRYTRLDSIILQVIVSWILIAIGVAVFGGTQPDQLIKTVSELHGPYKVVGVSWTFGYSLILCAVASGICLFICLPLLILDQRLSTHAGSQSSISFVNNDHVMDVPYWESQYPIPAQTYDTIQNTTLGSSQGFGGHLYGQHQAHTKHGQVVAPHGKASISNQFPPTTQPYVTIESPSDNPTQNYGQPFYGQHTVQYDVQDVPIIREEPDRYN